MEPDDKGKDFLFAVNPLFRSLKDKIIDNILIKIISTSKEDYKGIKAKINKIYGIAFEDILLKEALNRLNEKELIKIDQNKDQPKHEVFQARGKAVRTLDSINSKRQRDFNTLRKWLILKVPQSCIFELDAHIEEIAIDFIRVISNAIDRSFYDITIDKDYFTNNPIDQTCKVQSISQDLANSLNEIYKNFGTYEHELDIINIINLCVFWSTFTRIFLYKDSIKSNLYSLALSTSVILDTNTLIAYFSRFDPNHEDSRKYITFLKNLNIRVCYAKKSEEELERKLKRTERAIGNLKYYPSIATRISQQANDPLMRSYFEERYLKWDYFKEDFYDSLSGFEKYLPSEDLEKDTAENASELTKSLKAASSKSSITADHDAYMISLVRTLRRNSEFELNNFMYWLLTTDTKLIQFEMVKKIREGVIPTTIYIKRVPYYFYSYAILRALIEGDAAIYNEAYELFIDAIWIIEPKRKDISSTLNEYKGDIRQFCDVEKKLLDYTKRILWKDIE